MTNYDKWLMSYRDYEEYYGLDDRGDLEQEEWREEIEAEQKAELEWIREQEAKKMPVREALEPARAGKEKWVKAVNA